ncbi:MAG TPA: hypothetical protein VF392_04640 [Terracidiphilus sp.]
MASPAELILAQTIALIEPLTRFDRSALLLRDLSSASANCTGTWTASIVFSSSSSDGKGKLPSGVRDAGSQAGMERAISQLLADERSSAVARLDAFCRAQAGLAPASHKPLAVSDCFSGVVRVGFAWPCGKCNGKGKVTCSKCMGNRKVKCTSCNGQGWSTCSSCSGSGKITCTRCNGQRGWYKQVEHTVFNSAANEYTKRYENVWEHCMSCQEGKVQCHACSNGRKNCFTCNQSGHVTCTLCFGSGEETCSACGGNAILHRVAETACNVTNSFAVLTELEDTEVRRTLAAWDFKTFAGLAEASMLPPALAADKLTRMYPASVALHVARVQCGGKDFALYGYGAPAQVFDFKGMVGHLLENDLAQLQSVLAGQSPTVSLPAALATMLQSEVNQQLCDAAQRSSLVGNGTVTQEHADKTVSALRKAMSHIYRVSAALGVGAITAISLVTLYLLYHFLYMIPERRMQGAAIYLAVILLSAVAAELLARQRTLGQFASGGKEMQQAAARLLKSIGTLRRWRWIAAGAVVASIVTFFAIVLR